MALRVGWITIAWSDNSFQEARLALRGYVDRADTMLLAGWALSEEDPTERPEIAIVQSGLTLLRLKPLLAGPKLRPALKLVPSNAPPLYVWRIWLPLTMGLKPGIPFDVILESTGRALDQGRQRVINPLEGLDPLARDALEFAPLFVPHLSFDEAGVALTIEVFSHTRDIQISYGNDRRSLGDWAAENIFRIPRAISSIRLSKQALQLPGEFGTRVCLTANARDDYGMFLERLRTLVIPRTVFDEDARMFPLPANANMTRVAGAPDVGSHLTGGLTTFLQLNEISLRYCGCRIIDHHRILDWGVGCGRVLRHFWEASDLLKGALSPEQTVIGLDIDKVNVDWCLENMGGKGDYRVLSLDGFDLEGGSVDFLYGISVMTHLSEHHQFIWLQEIRRVLRVGGYAVLTTHGEWAIYKDPTLLAMPFAAKFGFFDGIPDAAIGQGRERYYRATYISRSYISENWANLLDVVDIIPATNAFFQDFIVLRRRE